MVKLILPLIFFSYLAGCASLSSSRILEDKSQPKSLDNACKILNEKKGWFSSLESVRMKYGVKSSVILAMMHQESKFKHDARPIKSSGSGLFGTPFASSAYGYAQALELTWAHYKRSTGARGVHRDSFKDSSMFMGWYISQSNKITNASKTDVYSQYLAYHEGQGGFNKKSYLKKPWLVDVAKKVQKRELMYARQLEQCEISNPNGQNWFVRNFM